MKEGGKGDGGGDRKDSTCNPVVCVEYLFFFKKDKPKIICIKTCKKKNRRFSAKCWTKMCLHQLMQNMSFSIKNQNSGQSHILSDYW